MLHFREYIEHAHQTPLYGIGLPEVTRTGRVLHLSYHTDPIRIHLQDGTVACLSHDDLRRLARMPRVGDLMSFTFLRNPRDRRRSESTILRAVIH